MATAEYTWLYRNDSGWLTEILPKVKPPALNFARNTDWNTKDRKLAESVPSAAEKIKQLSGKPIRITKKEIGILINFKGLTERALKNLPLTRVALTHVAESIEDFQIRRARYIVDHFLRDGVPLKKWAVIAKAGINSGCSEKVHEEIERLLAAGLGR